MTDRSHRPTSRSEADADALAGSRAYHEAAGDVARSPGGIAHEVGDLHRLLVESVQDYAIFALDINGCILSWNPGAERVHAYTGDEIIGRYFSLLFTPEDLASGKPERELATALAEGRAEDQSWRVRKDGSRFWANVVITALRDHDGRLLGFAKVTRDLTERRAAEDALRQSEERFRLLVQSVREYAIFLLDPDGHVASWNDGAERIKGYTSSEIIGKHFSTFYPPEDIADRKPERELEIAIRTGKYEEEGWRIRKDGSRFWANVLITAIRNDAGRLIGFAKVTRDLTERVAAQERAIADARRVATEEAARDAAESRARELRELADLLHLQTGELERRGDEAERANRAKAEFLAAMSHELRTPLNAIGGYAELLELGVSGPVTEQQREHLDRIRRSQQHLLGIINDILNFSRIEAGQLTYDVVPVPVRDALQSVVHMIAPQASAKNLLLEALDCPADAIARADGSKLEQILLNLLSNAVKFTSSGGRITLSCTRTERDVSIHVRDTGMGIPADQTEAIFEPFVQVGRSLTNVREGTGLGLAISRDLARAMGGDVTVKTDVGIGSTFTLQLPAATPTAPESGR